MILSMFFFISQTGGFLPEVRYNFYDKFIKFLSFDRFFRNAVQHSIRTFYEAVNFIDFEDLYCVRVCQFCLLKEGKMTVRVLMTRKIPRLTGGLLNPVLVSKLNELLLELRDMANHQYGYISGETMRNVDDRNEYLVISTWRSLEAWQRWFANEKRAEKEGIVDTLLGTSTTYKVYSYE